MTQRSTGWRTRLACLTLARVLAGTIALEERKFDQAIAELAQGNRRDPATLYRLGLAYQGKGDRAKAAKFFQRAANQNTLPTLNYAFVRLKAKTLKNFPRPPHLP